jgi:hypothetical protein
LTGFKVPWHNLAGNCPKRKNAMATKKKSTTKPTIKRIIIPGVGQPSKITLAQTTTKKKK